MSAGCDAVHKEPLELLLDRLIWRAADGGSTLVSWEDLRRIRHEYMSACEALAADVRSPQPTAQEPPAVYWVDVRELSFLTRENYLSRERTERHRYPLYAAMQTRGQTDFAQRSSSDCTTVPGLSGDSSVADHNSNGEKK